MSRYLVDLLNKSGGMHLFLYIFAVQSAALSLQKQPAVPQKEQIMCGFVSSLYWLLLLIRTEIVCSKGYLCIDKNMFFNKTGFN